MWVRVEAKDALRFRGSTQAFDGLRHQSLWRQEARQPRMPREEHAVRQLPHSGHASSTTDVGGEAASFIDKPHRAHSLSNQLTRQVLAESSRAALIPLGVGTAKTAMPSFAKQIQVTDLIARKHHRVNLASPGCCDFAAVDELAFRNFGGASIVANHNVRERVTGQLLISRTLHDRFHKFRSVEASRLRIVPTRNAVIPIAGEPHRFWSWQIEWVAAIRAILRSQHEMPDSGPGGRDIVTREKVEQRRHNLAHSFHTDSVIGIARTSRAPSHLKIKTDRQHSGCHVESFPNAAADLI